MTSSSLYYVEPKSRQVFRLLGDVSTGADRMRLDILQPDVVWLTGPGGHVFASQQLFVTDSLEKRNVYKQSTVSSRYFPIVRLNTADLSNNVRLPMHKYERSKSLFFRPDVERRDIAYANSLRKNSYPPIRNNNSGQSNNNNLMKPMKSLLTVRALASVEQRQMELSVSPPLTVAKLETPRSSRRTSSLNSSRNTPRNASATEPGSSEPLLPKLGTSSSKKRVKFHLIDENEQDNSGVVPELHQPPESASVWVPEPSALIGTESRSGNVGNNENDVNNLPASYYEAIKDVNMFGDEDTAESHDGSGADDDDREGENPSIDVQFTSKDGEQGASNKSNKTWSLIKAAAFLSGKSSHITQELMAPPRSKSDLLMRKMKQDEQRKIVYPCQGRLMIAALTGQSLDETAVGDEHFEDASKETLEDEEGELTDEKWLEKQCIVSERIKNACARAFFQVNSGGTDEITLDEVMQGLKLLNPDLSSSQMSLYYLENICNSIGISLNEAQRREAFGMDLQSFTIVGAVAMRITQINEGLKTFLSAKLRYHDIDNVLSKLRALWMVCRDQRTDRVGPEKFQVLLRAACFNPMSQHILTRFKFPNGIDFVDFLAYSPLFLFIHRAIINNPLSF